MSDIGLSNALNANANADTEHADASANAASDGSFSAHDTDVSYGGSHAADASYSVDAPELPDAPEIDAVADATGSAHATVDQVSADAEAAVSGATGLDVPEVPELDGVDGALSGNLDGTVTDHGVDVSGMFDGWIHAMEDAMAHLTASLSAVFGF